MRLVTMRAAITLLAAATLVACAKTDGGSEGKALDSSTAGRASADQVNFTDTPKDLNARAAVTPARAAAPPPKGYQVLTAPVTVPDAVPPSDVMAPADEAGFSGKGVAAGTSKGIAPGVTRADTGGAASAAGASRAAPNEDASSMIIRTGTATIEVDSLDAAIARVQALARRVGGYVANTAVQAGRNQLRSASIEVKVPAQRWQEIKVGLAPIGRVEAVDEQAEDVGEEFVDVNARVANARRLEQRLIELLATRTGKLTDVLSVERELARVREEIERYEGRLRYLRAHAALSTLTVSLHEKVPVIAAAPGRSVLGEAAKDAWRNFVGFVAGFIALLGVLVPVGMLVAGAYLVGRRWIPRGAPSRVSIAPRAGQPVAADAGSV